MADDILTSTKSEITQLVEKLCLKEKLQNYTIEISSGSKKGDNYCGEIYSVKILQDKKVVRDIIAKLSFRGEEVRTIAPFFDLYNNEVRFYNEILPALQKLLIENGLEPLNNFAKCYAADATEGYEYLLLENLKTLNFELFDKAGVFDETHNTLILKTYAKFHATSFALKCQQPELYESVTRNIKLENIKSFMLGLKVNESLTPLCQMVFSFLPEGAEEIKAKFGKYAKDAWSIHEKLLTEDGVGDYKTITHGDCWNNNFLFRYLDNGTGKTLQEMMALDFQMVTIASPVRDLSYFFYTCNTGETLKKLDFYLELYHNEFSSHLKKLGHDPEVVFPFSELKKAWKKYVPYGMILAIFMQMVKLTKTEDAIDLKEYEETRGKNELPKCDMGEFKKRMLALLEHINEIDGF